MKKSKRSSLTWKRRNSRYSNVIKLLNNCNFKKNDISVSVVDRLVPLDFFTSWKSDADQCV